MKACLELKLVINAIIPMNKLGLLHLDIKSLNILRNKSTFANKNIKISLMIGVNGYCESTQ